MSHFGGRAFVESPVEFTEAQVSVAPVGAIHGSRLLRRYERVGLQKQVHTRAREPKEDPWNSYVGNLRLESTRT